MEPDAVESYTMRFTWLKALALIVVLFFVFTACGGGGGDAADDARLKAEAKLAELKKKKEETKKPKNQPQTTEIKMPSAQEVLDEVGVTYTYDPINKPDPFRSYNPTEELSLTGDSDNPLLKFEVRYFKLVGIVKDTENPLAIFEDPSGKAYTVRVGHAIGKNGGVIRSVLEDAVVITETRISWRTEGTETVEVTIRLRPENEA